MKNLKRILAAALVLCMLFCFVGCGGDTAATAKVKVIDIPLSSEEYAFAVAQDNTEFLNQVNDFLKKIKGNGTFDDICNNYFGDGEPLSIESATLDESKDQLNNLANEII